MMRSVNATMLWKPTCRSMTDNAPKRDDRNEGDEGRVTPGMIDATGRHRVHQPSRIERHEHVGERRHGQRRADAADTQRLFQPVAKKRKVKPCGTQPHVVCEVGSLCDPAAHSAQTGSMAEDTTAADMAASVRKQVKG